ncbi:MAG TPA: hypothetical protein VK158_00305 [Acidobacteriota bacterium]|nr:hypothetical protein [Acidobacteriota bacterium]
MPALIKKKMNRRAQGAVEFAITLGILLFVFLFFFIIVTRSYTDLLVQRDGEVFAALIRDINREISLASTAPDGYERTFTLQDQGIAKDYTLSINNRAEVVLEDDSGYSQIIFLLEDDYLYGDICENSVNGIMKLGDYGLAMCCGGCNGSFPGVDFTEQVECKRSTDTYWDDCDNLSVSDNLTLVRGRCNLNMTYANITIQNISGAWPVANYSSDNWTIRNMTSSWVSAELPGIVMAAGNYNVSVRCYNNTATGWSNKSFTVS